jgi:hypothetical protein
MRGILVPARQVPIPIPIDCFGECYLAAWRLEGDRVGDTGSLKPLLSAGGFVLRTHVALRGNEASARRGEEDKGHPFPIV